MIRKGKMKFPAVRDDRDVHTENKSKQSTKQKLLEIVN